MKITAIAPWFGSKRTLAPQIVEALGPHASYWGLFCGSLAVELEKSPAAHETVVDMHGDVTNLARVLQREETATELYARLTRTLPAESLYVEAQSRCAEPVADDAPNLDRAYAYFVTAWLGRNGVAGTVRGEDVQLAVRWTHGGGSPSTRFRSAVESIPAWHVRLLNILVLRRSVFDVLPRIEDESGTVIYADPPYLLGGARTGRDGQSRYLHEFTPADHERLAVEFSRFRKTRVVISYYADPRLDDLYPGWRQVLHTRPKNLSVQGRRGATKQEAPEVLLVNDGPDVRPPAIRSAPTALFGA